MHWGCVAVVQESKRLVTGFGVKKQKGENKKAELQTARTCERTGAQRGRDCGPRQRCNRTPTGAEGNRGLSDFTLSAAVPVSGEKGVYCVGHSKLINT